MLSAGTLTYLEPETFTLIVFYNMLQLIIIIIIIITIINIIITSLFVFLFFVYVSVLTCIFSSACL
jgi:hypothetical protein